MSWKNITKEEKILPGGNNANEVILEDGKPKRIRLLLKPGEEPYSFFQHSIEHEHMGDNGQMQRDFRTVSCGQTSKNPNAPCKLCFGQQMRRRTRHVAPVWEYTNSMANGGTDGTVKFLIAGDTLWSPIATLAKMGIDVSTMDFMVSRIGKDRNDTTYTSVNLGATPFTWPADFESPDLESLYGPATEDQMKSVVEMIGLDWDKVTTPPTLTYQASLQEALDHTMPNGKYKGQTLGTIYATNKGMIEYLAKSDRVSPEKSGAQIILVAMAGANIPGVPNYSVGGTPMNAKAPLNQAPDQNAKAPENPPATGAPSTSNGIADKITAVNNAVASAMQKSGASPMAIMDTIKKCGHDKTQINLFTPEELDALLAELNK